MADNIRQEDWEWADALFWESDWADLVNVEETEYIPETGIHVYTLDTGANVLVLPSGNVVLGDPEDLDSEACPGCGCLPGDGLTEGCNHPEGCGFFRQFAD